MKAGVAVKQIIIARKDLNMSPGKLAAQVAHASIAFLLSKISDDLTKGLKWPIRRYRTFDWEHPSKPAVYIEDDLTKFAQDAFNKGQQYIYVKSFANGRFELCEPKYEYFSSTYFDSDTVENWINGHQSKIVCEAKNLSHIMAGIEIAKSIGLEEGEDFFIIRDACRTELTPENVNESGEGWTLTCVGFRPLPDEVAEKISKKFQLYK